MVEGLDDPPLVSLRSALAPLASLFAPATLEDRDDRGGYLYSVRVIYGRNLFRASFLVSATGVVEMLDDEPLAELPQPLQRPFEPLAARERPLFDGLSGVAPGLKRPNPLGAPGVGKTA